MDSPFVEPFTTFFKNQHIKIDIVKITARRITHWRDAVIIRPYWRFYWANKRGGRFFQNGETFDINSNCFTVIPPYIEMKHEFFESFDIFNLNAHLEEPFHLYPNIFQVDLGEDFIKIIENIVRDPNNEMFYRQAELQMLVLKVIMNLDEKVMQLCHTPQKITEVIQYMKNNISEYLSNDVLAKFCGMSTNSFIRLFSKETHVSPQEFLRNIRLDASANLLVQTDLSIDEITKRCGFSERNYFSRVFSRRFKMGPVSYRKGDVHL